MDDLDKEYWKKIEDYDYLISTEGRVKNKYDYIMKQQIDICGYYRVTLSNRKKHTDRTITLFAKKHLLSFRFPEGLLM